MSAASSSSPASSSSSDAIKQRGADPPILRPHASASSHALLRLLWRDLQANHIEYSKFFSNHLAHGMIALQQMGASAERLERFWPHACESLEPLPAEKSGDSKPPLTRDNFMSRVGKGECWADWLDFFRSEWMRIDKELSVSNSDEQARALRVEHVLLNEFAPLLVPFVAGHATHPLIHLGLGRVLSDADPPMWLAKGLPDPAAPLVSERKDQAPGSLPGRDLVPVARMNPLTISGLSYLCYHGLNLGCGPEKYTADALSRMPHTNSLSLLQLLPKATAAFAPFVPLMEKKIKQPPYSDMPIGDFQRRVQVVADEAAASLYEIDVQWRIDAADTSAAGVELQHVALVLYGLSANDFFMLHGVTSLFALRHLLPHLDQAEHRVLALRYGLKTLLAVYVVQHMPEKDNEAIALALSRDDGLLAAIRDTMRKTPEFLEHDWRELIDSAISSNDEHTQKLVWACYNEAQRLSASSTAGSDESKSAWKEWCRWCAAKRIAAKEETFSY